ncbi:molybdopterin-dependent oxidoreductase [Granulicella arctica]|uniref:molybdopterin-dependent oxidoreductase n=1 Tax=Granulicella arctica TaxID=940613 RepID=UPI0021E07687|nr:molybdopterin-dependent oxidoreductase [Granulicella arctica]
MSNPTEEQMELDQQVKRASGKRTRRSFLAAALAATGGYELYRWIDQSNGDQRIPKPLRKAINFDTDVAKAVFDDRGLSPTYPRSQAIPLRTNGDFGLKTLIEPENYRLQVAGVANPKKYAQYMNDVTAWDYKFAEPKPGGPGVGASNKEAPKAPMPKAFEDALAAMKKAQGGKRPRGQEESGESDTGLDPGTPGLLLTMDDVLKLPRHELITEFKCIEGWSQITQWAGLRLKDFIEAYPPERNEKGELPKYVYMETPDGDYYCGFDLRVCQHPQSLLATEMMGQPLSHYQGAPLRLHMPIKYGYKQIKRIGLIAYTDDKPDDYWTKLGYDWYAGL